MTPPLPPMTDDDIAAARKLCETSDSYRELGAAYLEHVPQLLAEIDRLRSQLRARTLSDEERETLSRLRDQTAAYGRNPKALAVLDKLLADDDGQKGTP